MMYPVVETPLIRLGNLFPKREVYAKCEFVAPSGSFKIRGAVYLLTRLSREGGSKQLVVPSMGNTALAAALAADIFGFRMVGVVPESISRAKDEKLRAFNVELVKISGGGSALLSNATRIAAERAAYFVHPHLDTSWTNGYQAIAEEVLQGLPACRSLVFPVGGGGLLMGLSEHLLHQPAPMRLVGCEPYNYPTYAPFSHERSRTIADGLVLEEPHAKVRERIRQLGIGIELVQESAMRTAMRDLYEQQGLVVEPSSAITVAAARARLAHLEEPICLILTGANISCHDFYQLIG
jgi:threonine dehydratase